MRSSWNGMLQVGLLAIPVKLYRATEDNEYALNQIHRQDGGKIRYVRECADCGKTVPYEDVGKGKLVGGQMITLTDEDLDSLPVPGARVIDVGCFISINEVDLTAFGNAYFIEPEEATVRIYALLRQQIKASGRVGVAVFAMRTKDSLAIVRARDKMLILQRIAWPAEVRVPAFSFLDQEVTVTETERNLASQLIDTMTRPWQPENYRSAYGDAMSALIKAKLEGTPTPEPPSPARQAATQDIGAVLQASIDAAKEKRGEEAA